MAWIDQHCHLSPGADGAAQVAAARAAGVERMITVGCHLEQSKQMAETREQARLNSSASSA